jgi:hypothetical protein
MSGLRIFGIVLIILGVLGLVYGRFSYTRKSHEADLGVPGSRFYGSPDHPSLRR